MCKEDFLGERRPVMGLQGQSFWVNKVGEKDTVEGENTAFVRSGGECTVMGSIGLWNLETPFHGQLSTKLSIHPNFLPTPPRLMAILRHHEAFPLILQRTALKLANESQWENLLN